MRTIRPTVSTITDLAIVPKRTASPRERITFAETRRRGNGILVCTLCTIVLLAIVVNIAYLLLGL